MLTPLERILPFYAGPKRHYHNWMHISSMIQSLLHYEAGGAVIANRNELIEAILWHDAVYVPGAPDHMNEKQSAQEYFRYWSLMQHQTRPNFQIVYDAIMATSDHFNPDFEPTVETDAWIMDLDLLGFATPFIDFVRINENIAAEFVELGGVEYEEVFRVHRLFLKNIGDKKLLKFHIVPDRDQLTEVAYRNINRFI